MTLKEPKKKEQKTTSLNIRLTKTERQRVEKLAAKAQMKPTTYARHALLEAIAYFERQEEE